ncbi:Rik1-associated factor 1 [Ancistrocladus abbreviatus]
MPIVKMKTDEVAKASIVVELPVCREEEKERCEGDFGIVVLDKAWDRWVVLPGWELVVGLGGKGGVVVSFGDVKALPWKLNRWYKEEPILVVADRGRKELTVNNGFYLVMMCHDNGRAGGGLKGWALKDKGG